MIQPALYDSASEREVSLLPRHWEWLSGQPRSISAALRLLVEQARRDPDGSYAAQYAKDRCYLYMRDNAGDRLYFEEACRALSANDRARFETFLSGWPQDIQREAMDLATSVWRIMADRRPVSR